MESHAERQVALPDELSTRRLVRRALTVVGLLVVVGLIAAFAPGLGEVRHHLSAADPAWIVVGVVLEFLSGVSYVAMFRPVFCRYTSWRTSWEIGWSELAVGSLVPASGAGGLALGAWILSQGGMPAEKIARRSVAFFLIKSSVNFVAVAVIGTAMALGVGPHRSLLLTALPAALSLAVIGAVLLLPRIGRGEEAARRRRTHAQGLPRASAARSSTAAARRSGSSAPATSSSSAARSATGRSTTPCSGRRTARSTRPCR